MLLPYTICFCRCGDRVLMLYRNKPPNAQHWNGLGGKLQADETPVVCVQREILEEAGIDLRAAKDLRFAGIVTWNIGVDPTSSSRGMYAFVADLSSEELTWEGNRVTPEGLLCWKPVEWVCDPQNTDVVENISHFLATMLTEKVPREYYCDFQNEQLVGVIVRPLSDPQFAMKFRTANEV